MTDDKPTIGELLRAAAGRSTPELEPERPSVGSADGGIRPNPPARPPSLRRLLHVASRGWDDDPLGELDRERRP